MHLLSNCSICYGVSRREKNQRKRESDVCATSFSSEGTAVTKEIILQTISNSKLFQGAYFSGKFQYHHCIIFGGICNKLF